MIRDDFLITIETFLDAKGMNATLFGRLAMNDSSFVHRIRNGGDVRLSTMEKVQNFMRDYGELRQAGAASDGASNEIDADQIMQQEEGDSPSQIELKLQAAE